MERTYATEFYEERREMKMKNRLHNPCSTCIEHDFCQSTHLPCKRREGYLQKRQQIRKHMKEIMERAKKERDNGQSKI